MKLKHVFDEDSMTNNIETDSLGMAITIHDAGLVRFVIEGFGTHTLIISVKNLRFILDAIDKLMVARGSV